MTKILPFLFLLIWTEGLSSQSLASIYSGRQGEVRFLSEAPLESIEASSGQLQGAINVEERKFAFLVDIRSFQGFNSALQREHFQENYMESELYPKAYFSGTFIGNVDLTQNGRYRLRAKGHLFIHGKSQERIIEGTIEVEKGIIKVESYFTVLLSDHDINIPRIVTQKIASEIRVWVNTSLTPRK